MIDANIIFQPQFNFRSYSSQSRTSGSRSQFMEELKKSILHHKEKIFLQDDHVEISGSTAIKFIEKIKQNLEKVCPEQIYVVVSLPTSAAQALTVLAVILSNRTPIVIHPTALNRVFVDLSDIQEPGVVIIDQEVIAPSRDLLQIIVNSKAEVMSDFSHKLYRNNFVFHVDQQNFPVLAICTSGSSGEPKIVGISFTAISYMVSILKEVLQLSNETIASISMPLFHTLALNTQFLPTILAGGRCVFTPAELQLNSLFRNYLKTKGNYLALIPEVLLQCYHEFKTKNLEPNRHVKTVVIAGSNISREHIRIAELLLPNAEIFKGYGLTEAIRVTMISNRDAEFYNDVAGYPLSQQMLSIRSKNGTPVSTGNVGEIFVKGPNTTNFYLKPSMTMHGSDGFLTTGDQGYINAKGMLVVLGRSDRVFKSQGRKISPAEIEKVAMADDLITQAVCVPQICGNKGLRSALFLRLNHELSDVEMARILAVLHEAIVKYLEPHKRPKEIFLSKSLPKLENGKPDFKTLKKNLDLGLYLPQKTINFKGLKVHWHDCGDDGVLYSEVRLAESL